MIRRTPFLLPERGFGSIDHGSSREQIFSARIGFLRTGASGRLGVGGMTGTIHRVDPLVSNPAGGALKHDLTGLMREWPFEGDRLQARIVALAEDREVLQVRTPVLAAAVAAALPHHVVTQADIGGRGPDVPTGDVVVLRKHRECAHRAVEQRRHAEEPDPVLRH